MAEYTCTIPAREYRDLVGENARLVVERQKYNRIEAELAAVKVELDETKKALAAKETDCRLWYESWWRLKSRYEPEAQNVGLS